MLNSIHKDEVENFLSSTSFTGYQSVPLPYGLHVPGIDRSKTADLVFSSPLEGASLLDVGTYYGYFPVEAIRRGAKYAVGLEMDSERYQIAKRISEFHGNAYQIVHGRIEEVEFSRQFDIVLLLNVLHHLTDPISVMYKLASLCQGTLIVEFCLPSDDAFIQYLYKDNLDMDINPFDKIRSLIRSYLLKIAAYKLPIIAIGNYRYHRTFYFSREAFINTFIVHHNLFEEVEFIPGNTGRNRSIAFCKVKQP